MVPEAVAPVEKGLLDPPMQLHPSQELMDWGAAVAVEEAVSIIMRLQVNKAVRASLLLHISHSRSNQIKYFQSLRRKNLKIFFTITNSYSGINHRHSA